MHGPAPQLLNAGALSSRLELSLSYAEKYFTPTTTCYVNESNVES